MRSRYDGVIIHGAEGGLSEYHCGLGDGIPVHYYRDTDYGVADIRDVNLAVLEVDGNIGVLSGDFTKRTVKKRKARKGGSKRTCAIWIGEPV